MGFDFGKFLKIAEILAGPALMAAGVPPTVIPLVVHGIQIAEVATTDHGAPTTGAEKKAIAMDAVRTGLAGINAAGGHVDPNIEQVVSHGIDATVGAIQAIQRTPITS